MNTPDLSPATPPPTFGQPSAVPPSSPPPYYGGGYYGELPLAGGGALAALNPLRLWQIARDKWLTILLAILFAGAAAAFYLSRSIPVYEAETRLELSVRRPRIVNKQDAMIEERVCAEDTANILNTQIEKFKNPLILPHVVAAYRELFPEDEIGDEELMQRLKRHAKFEIIRNTRLVRVLFSDSDPEFAERACAAFAAGVEAAVRAENRSGSNAAVAWLEAQAQLQKKELEEADQALLDARQKHQMDVLAGQRKTIEESLLRFNARLSEIEAMASSEQKMLDTLGAGKLPSEIPGAEQVTAALDRCRQALAERNSLLSRYTPQHPAVAAQDKVIQLYREQAVDAFLRARNTAAANLQLYHAQADGLRQKQEELLATASRLDGEILVGEMKITGLTRTRDAADASYLGLLNRIQEARLSADENTATVKQVAEIAPAVQIYPQPLRILLLGLVLGLAGGFGLAFLTDTLADRVVGAADIEDGTGLKAMAVLPHVKSRDRQAIATASLTHRFGELAEAFAGLRSILDSPLYREQTKVILVASSLPAEGKTTTCCNLAIASARNGQKTLLIDFDLRRPLVRSIFPEVGKKDGLLEFLHGDGQNPEEIVAPSGCCNLSIIGSRVIDKSRPAEIVGGAKVATLLAWARANFDRVILDVPPLGIVSDALTLAAHVDCVLLMARPATSRKHAIRHTVQRFRDVGMTNIAIIMNDIIHSKFSYQSYGPYYHYQKHYGAYAQPVPESKAT